MFKVKEISQIGIIVRDIEKAMDNFWRVLGWGPWKCFTAAPPVLTKTTLRGEDTPFTMKIGLYNLNNIQIELIQPLSGRNLYQEFLDSNSEGLHHLACFDSVKELETLELHMKELEEKGLKVNQSGRVNETTRFHYFDTQNLFGTAYETAYRDRKRELEEYNPEDEGIEPPEFKLKEISHLGIVVNDLYSTMENYCRYLGWRPWDVYPVYTPDILNEPFVDGKEQPFVMKVAVNKLENVRAALIQPISGPSIYADHLETKGEGIHHFESNGQIVDLETLRRHQKELDGMGFGVIQSGRVHDSAFYYYDTRETLGGVIYQTGARVANMELGPLPEPEGTYP